MMNALHDTLRLNADDPSARTLIAATVDALLAEDTVRLQVILDGDRLASETIAGLVAGLRRLRERGGAIQVTAVQDGVRDALAITGLERVFAFPIEQPEPRRSGLFARLTAATFAAGLTALAVPAPAAVDRPTDPTAIIARVVERNPNLSSYQGRLHVDLRMTSFPFYRTALDGTTYYKKPSNFEVVFDRVPRLAKGFDKMFTDIGDASNWEKRFVVTYQGEAEFNGRKDLELRMVQRVRGMIDHETVLIDPNAWTIDSIRYDYYNGGHITMKQSFREIAGYLMPAEQDAEIAIPYAKAVVHGVYTDYKTNVALDDAVFTKKN
ncbi:MAG: hypothetical protein JWN27_2365 [Candidatus Eremiobacteraeota bacterium]|nr:hypothetical protein [Candidatus Eremiobacteraeota bacterium]